MKFIASSLGPPFRQIKMAFPNISNADRLAIAIGRIDLEELTVSPDTAVEFSTINPECILFILFLFASAFYVFFVEWIIRIFHADQFRYFYYYAMIVDVYIILTLIEKSICDICYFATTQFPAWKSWQVIRTFQLVRFLIFLLYTHEFVLFD